MKEKLKKWWNKWLCRHFGHIEVIEIYVIDHSVKLKKFGFRRNLYMVVQDTVCARCGKLLDRKYLTGPISRAQLLHDGWFVEKGGKLCAI